jgi:hypothetical protein
MLSVVLYGCDAWSLTLRVERRLGVFENRIMRRIFGPKRDANGEWRRLNNKELHSLCQSPNVVRAINSKGLKWAGHVPRMEKSRSAFKIYQVNLQERDLSEEQDVNGNTILERFLNK